MSAWKRMLLVYLYSTRPQCAALMPLCSFSATSYLCSDTCGRKRRRPPHNPRPFLHSLNQGTGACSTVPPLLNSADAFAFAVRGFGLSHGSPLGASRSLRWLPVLSFSPLPFSLSLVEAPRSSTADAPRSTPLNAHRSVVAQRYCSSSSSSVARSPLPPLPLTALLLLLPLPLVRPPCRPILRSLRMLCARRVTWCACPRRAARSRRCTTSSSANDSACGNPRTNRSWYTTHAHTPHLIIAHHHTAHLSTATPHRTPSHIARPAPLSRAAHHCAC